MTEEEIKQNQTIEEIEEELNNLYLEKNDLKED